VKRYWTATAKKNEGCDKFGEKWGRKKLGECGNVK
jgi:hypothetical protein